MAGFFGEQLLQNRRRKRQRLAGAGLGAGDDVVSRQRMRNHGALHGPRAFEPELVEAHLQARVETQRDKRQRRRVGIDLFPRKIG